MDGEDNGLDCSEESEHQANEKGGAEGKPEPPKNGQRSRKVLSKAERERRQKVRLANQFPNGPEARELASMEKPMPASLRDRIRRGGKYELWSEAFSWLAADLHRKARNGAPSHGDVELASWEGAEEQAPAMS